MPEKQSPDGRELTPEELRQEGAEELPDREAMSLLNLDVNLDLGLDAAAPVNAAVAANLNVAAPIDAAVSANVGSIDSTSMAVADQDSVIIQTIEADATATADQTSSIEQGG